MRQHAKKAAESGLSVFPLATKTQPLGSWKGAQSRRASPDGIAHWPSSARAYAVVCGAVSGGLVALDVETHDALIQIYDAASPQDDMRELLEKIGAGWTVRTPSGGWHLLFRISDGAPRNLKLAHDEHGAIMIETRGEGGYVVGAGSPACAHSEAAEHGWETTQGGPDSIASITSAECGALFALCRALDRSPIQKSEPSATKIDTRESPYEIGARVDPRHAQGRPGDAWIADVGVSGIVELLQRHGYHTPRSGSVAGRGGVTYLRRPGRDGRDHPAVAVWHSAPHYITVHSGTGPLSAPDGRALSPLAALAQLEHAGDMSAAASALARAGYGDRQTLDVDATAAELAAIDLSDHVFEEIASEIEAERKEEADLRWLGSALEGAAGTRIGDIAMWILDSAPAPQPILALGAACAIWGHVISRRCVTQTGIGGHLYHLLTAPTGRGKDWPLRAANEILGSCGYGARVVGEPASEAAYYSALETSIEAMATIDEAGMMLAAMTHERAPHHVIAKNKALLSLFGATGRVQGKSYADASRSILLDAPALTVLMATTPATLWPHLGSRSVADGLMGRLLLWDVPESAPRPGLVLEPRDRGDVPRAITGPVSSWIERDDRCVVPYDAGAVELLTEIYPTIPDEPTHVRVMATAQSLALAHHTATLQGARGDVGRITAPSVQWGIDLALRSADAIARTIAARGDRTEADRQREARMDAIVAVLRRRRRSWWTMRQIVAATRAWDRRERADALETLTIIQRIQHRAQAPGHPEAWRAV